MSQDEQMSCGPEPKSTQSSGRGSDETVSKPGKRKNPKNHIKEGRQVRTSENRLYYSRCSWCTAKPRVLRYMSVQLCCAPTSTECPDMSSYKAATEVWWRSEDAIPTISNMPSEKKKTPSKSEEKVGRQMPVAKLNNLCNTFDKEELCDGSA